MTPEDVKELKKKLSDERSDKRAEHNDRRKETEDKINNIKEQAKAKLRRVQQ